MTKKSKNNTKESETALEDIQSLADLIKYVVSEPLPAVKRTPITPNKANGLEMIVVLSDVHVGKKTKSFDVGVFDKRLKALRDFVETEVKAKRPTKLHVVLAGDIVDGDTIFPGQVHEIEIPVIQQYFYAADSITEFISHLSKLVPVNVPCVYGNHGRMGMKGDSHHLANWDYLLYHYIQAKLERNKEIKFFIADDWALQYMIAGENFFLTHGDEIKGGGSFNTILGAAKGWVLSVQFDWKYMIMGHFHQPYLIPMGGRTILGNGTFVSDDTWALKVLKQWVEPTQKVLTLSYEGVLTSTDFPLSHAHEKGK